MDGTDPRKWDIVSVFLYSMVIKVLCISWGLKLLVSVTNVCDILSHFFPGYFKLFLEFSRMENDVGSVDR